MGYDLVVRNGIVVDGTRAARYRADVAVTGDRISALGAVAEKGTTEIDASGLVVAPGFIDAHTHDDRLMLSAPEMAPKVSQGVTTVVAGNCGISLAPAPRGMRLPVLPPIDLLDDAGGWFRFRTFGSYVKELNASPAATNCALLVGHTMLRAQTMEDLQRPATENEVEEMRRLAAEALASGAIGVSTGLYYEPARAATTEEVIQVCRPLAEHGGIYCTHMRDEGARVIDSLDESFRIGRELGVPVVISHHKVVGTPNHGRSVETLPFIERAMRSQRIALDCYPYCASSTILSYSRTLIASTTLVTWSKPHPEFAGCRLDEVAAKMGLGIEQAVQRLLPAGAIYFSMDEADVQRILAFEHTMIGSDGLPHDTAPHPRLWGSFPRVLGHYSRGLNLFPLETAVYKMTGLTAQSFGLEGRGVLREGAFADLAIFDPGAVDEAASFAQPIRPAKGIHAVIVNGSVVWKDGQPTGARPGRILRRGG
jgi:N-acyl-D-amino-acid deacylase